MPEISVTENLWIPLADGRRLAAKVWLPAGAGPAPAILEYLPYRKRDGTAHRDATTHPVFASHGYACIRVDIAGTGESDGVFDDEYSERELSDGEEAVAPETRRSILTFAFQLHRIILYNMNANTV